MMSRVLVSNLCKEANKSPILRNMGPQVESVAVSRQQVPERQVSDLYAASQVVGPIAQDKADNLLPVSKAAFAEVRATNAALRASDASLEASNAQNVAVLDAAEAKLQELFPVGPDSCTCPCTHSCACAN